MTSEGSASSMSHGSSAQGKELPALRQLQAKYNAALAENEQLHRDLRNEQAQHKRYRLAYLQVQDDVQKDQDILRQLYAQIEPTAEVQREAVGTYGDENTASAHASDRARLSNAAVATASGGKVDRVDALERDCAYLQAKVENLHLALQRYESSDIHHNTAAPVASLSPHSPQSLLSKEREAAATVAAASSAALKAEQDSRRRVEEQLTRCHATLRSLRDDAAQKEVYFHQQLSALQEQNAALLADLDMWVTGEQQTLLSNAFASRLGVPPKEDVPPTSCSPSSVSSSAPVTTKEAVRDGASLELRQMQQYLNNQEEVLELKEKSIKQLEARVHELEKQAVYAPVHQNEGNASLNSFAIEPKQLFQMRQEAAAAEECVQRLADSHFPAVYVVPPSTTCAPLRGGTFQAASAEATVSYIHDVLRYVREVLSLERHTSRSANLPHRDADAALRVPPLTVIQPSVASSSYRSGETLSEAAQQLAKLMRRHVQPQ